MYQHLENLRPDLPRFLASLSPVAPDRVEAIRTELPNCPEEYLRFLLERGYGHLTADGEPFYFAPSPVSAVSQYFQDDLIYQGGAAGDIWIFGWENSGTAYGFDSGAGWRLAEVDEYREVSELQLSFRKFVEGLLVCYPQIPMSFRDGAWLDGLGREYRYYP